MFEIFDNDMSLGYTSKVETTKDDVFAATPEEALQDDRFSKGVFELSKGKHIITIKAEGPHEAGTAAIRVLNHAPVSFGKKKKDSNKKKTVTVTETLHVPAHTKHKHPIEFDTSHTITRTKTNWVVVTPTSTSVPPIYSPMYPPQGYPEYPPQHPEYPPNHWEDEE
ncbi:hypothetical protein BDB01DRAFT_778396 [Pilobolus umbonatus]|nr:hypothetical protein BDB01DRAFT_778396 [Pilobolus umbonatus]